MYAPVPALEDRRSRPSIFALLTLALIGVATACGGGGGSQLEEFTNACLEFSNMEEPVCACLARKAETDLADNERAFVIASLRKNEEEAARLRGDLGLEGAMKAGMFMTNAGACALETSGEGNE